MLPMKHPDPSPSRMQYRFERLWLKKSVRRLVKVWLPAIAVCSVVGLVVSSETMQNAASSGWQSVRDTIASRPELRITHVEMPNTSSALHEQILAVTNLTFPASSLDIDVDKVKQSVERLDAVLTADVMITTKGALRIVATERTPVIVWRDAGILHLIDTEGNRVAELASRAARADLPLIVGMGAEQAVPEALLLLETLAPLADRLRGFVRVGERRWDIVLDRNQTIMLPAKGAVSALKHVLALHQAEDMLNRDVVIVDMRNPSRPVLRLTDTAIAELRKLRAVVRGDDA